MMKKTNTDKPPRETTLIVHEIDKVFPKAGNQPYALGCTTIDIATGEQVNALISFDFSELLFVVSTGKTLNEILNAGKESTK
jgi:hypothetical protein